MQALSNEKPKKNTIIVGTVSKFNLLKKITGKKKLTRKVPGN
jgi:hypothetical protein